VLGAVMALVDAFSIYLTLAAVFVAQATNTPLSFGGLMLVRSAVGTLIVRRGVSHIVQTVIGTEAALREGRPARRLTAASIGPGPTA
jgi:aerobic C4-dicarboxylate transport protein